ncbi:MAG: DNA polymerase III subunit alpha [Sutterella wadsworthensis]|nr:DNA polymerase III subunit alpha [Sutterella wadsworthensis]
MTEPRFVHLRMHTEYSVTDGITRIDPAIHKVAKDGGVALGITDLMNVFGGLRFYTHAQAAGLKPVMGCDIKVKNSGFPDNPYRMALLCMNHTGYHSLCELLTRAFLSKDDEYRGQIEEVWFDEEGATEGLILLTGGPDGRLGRLISLGMEKTGPAELAQWAERFPGRLYVELQRAGRPNDESIVRFLANLAAEAKLPVVATHPIQFLKKEDFEAHEVRCCIAEGYTLSDPRREKRYSAEQYLKSEEEMCALFADIPSALANSVEIAKRCNLDGVLSKPQLPHFPTPEGMTLDDYMDHLAHEGLDKRLAFLYPDEKEREEKRPQYEERLQYELGIIKKMQFPGYFLIVQDFINWSKTHGVPVGPGRGSGAGSLVAYSLGITDLDPLKYDLLFERFLNPERVSMPDFDVDFCQYNRDRTIEYVKDTYGADAVSQIATFGTLGAKAVVRDVGRVLNMPFGKVDRLSKMIPAIPGKNVTLKETLETVPEFKEATETDEQYKELLRLATPLEGVTRNLGMHAGGVLIAPGKLTDFCPLYNSDGAPENTISQYDKKDVENVGLVKFDFLGLTTLSILQKAKEYIDALNPGTDFELERIPIDDKETYDCFQKGNTVAIFQFESPGMRNLLRDAKPDCLEDLVALNALYRPGPMDLIPDYIARKFGKQEVTYLDDRMEPVLRETYGIMVYQEQVMRVAQVVGGYSLGGADLLRRAMGKKNVEEMKRQRAVFVKGAGERGVKESVATEIFDLMEKFAGYGFNKSHAAAYSYVAYQTAYLKVHHTAAFMAANLCMVMDQAEKMKALLDDAKANGVSILPPDINKSDWFFTAPDAKHIRFGLGGIKNMGQQQIEQIMQSRKEEGPFKDIFDLTARVPGISARSLEQLIRAGAFDSIDLNRGRLFGNVKQAVTAGQTVAASAGQSSLFGEAEEEERVVNWVDAPSWAGPRQLQEEKAALGFWLSGHMFDYYAKEVKHFKTTPLQKVAALQAPKGGMELRIAGIVTDTRVIQGKKGRFGAVMLDDGESSLEVSCFSEVWEKYRTLFEVDNLVCLRVHVRWNEFRKANSISVVDAMGIETFRERTAEHIMLDIEACSNEDFEELKTIVSEASADSGLNVGVTIRSKDLVGTLYLPVTVRASDEVIEQFAQLKGVTASHVAYPER